MTEDKVRKVEEVLGIEVLRFKEGRKTQRQRERMERKVGRNAE